MLFPVIALTVYGVCMAVVLRAPSRMTKTRQPEQLPEIPRWAAPEFWTQDRVDAQFRAMTFPISR